MPLQLEHDLVLCDDLDKVRDFYRDVLGMTQGFRPELEFPPFSLYLRDGPCIHIAEWRSYAVWTKKAGLPVSSRASATGPATDIAVNGIGFDEVCAPLVARVLPFSECAIDDSGLEQAFLREPNGVPIGFNFRN